MQDERDAQAENIQAEAALAGAFSPHAPINRATLFRGRPQRIRDVVDAVTADGLHVVIYGERGVGKTSLANIVHEYVGGIVSVSKVICGQGDTFSSVIRRALGSIQLSLDSPQVGLVRTENRREIELLALLPAEDSLVPDGVASLLARVPSPLVLVIDEFDRVSPSETAAFADLIKASSDRGAATTLVLVGVAEDIDTLLGSHASVVRNLRQVNLPRMSDGDLSEIVDEGLASAGFSIEETTRFRVVSVSQGFPHFTHLLAQNAARAALDDGRRKIEDADVAAGMAQAVERSDQSIRDAYYKAATGVRKNNLWPEVIAACALAESNERGYFATRAVQDAMSGVIGQPVAQQKVAYHLGKLTSSDRGPLLQRTGPRRRYRYRFENALMRPFILMKATSDGLLS